MNADGVKGRSSAFASTRWLFELNPWEGFRIELVQCLHGREWSLLVGWVLKILCSHRSFCIQLLIRMIRIALTRCSCHEMLWLILVSITYLKISWCSRGVSLITSLLIRFAIHLMGGKLVLGRRHLLLLLLRVLLGTNHVVLVLISRVMLLVMLLRWTRIAVPLLLSHHH